MQALWRWGYRDARAVVLALVLAIHAGLLLALSAGVPTRPVGATNMITVYAVAVPAAPPESAPARRTMSEPRSTPRSQQPASEGEQQVCAPLDAVGSALAADDAARDAVSLIPLEAGSTTLWSGAWAPGAEAPDAPLAPVRIAAQEALLAIQGRCLDQPILGPRLIILPVEGGTRVLVFGSGEWRWRDLATGPTVVRSKEIQ